MGQFIINDFCILCILTIFAFGQGFEARQVFVAYVLVFVIKILEEFQIIWVVTNIVIVVGIAAAAAVIVVVCTGHHHQG